MLTLIDADSIIYIVGWNFKDRDPTELGIQEDLGQTLDAFVHGVLQVTQATKYAGYFSCPTAECFRTKIATVKPYKGTRPDKPEWIRTWEPHIKKWLMEMWQFEQAIGIEADDCVAGMADITMHDLDVCIASNDKDLKQVPCSHYSYKTKKIEDINEERASELFWTQVLTGDVSDNIGGLPRCGPVKAARILKGHDYSEFRQLVKNEFIEQLGDDYGVKLFDETVSLVKMLNGEELVGTGFVPKLHHYDLEGVRDRLQNNPVYNKYNGSNNDYSFSDFL